MVCVSIVECPRFRDIELRSMAQALLIVLFVVLIRWSVAAFLSLYACSSMIFFSSVLLAHRRSLSERFTTGGFDALSVGRPKRTLPTKWIAPTIPGVCLK